MVGLAAWHMARSWLAQLRQSIGTMEVGVGVVTQCLMRVQKSKCVFQHSIRTLLQTCVLVTESSIQLFISLHLGVW